MAPTAPQIYRSLLVLMVSALFLLPNMAWGVDAVQADDLQQAEITLPDRERLPLGGSSTQAGVGDTASAGGYLPDVLEFVRVGGALLGVVALLFGLRLVLKRLGGMPSARRPSGVVQIHGRYPVARGQQVVLLQVGQRIIVAHQGSAGMRTLSEITDPAEVAQLRAVMDGGESHASGTEFQQALAEAAAVSDDQVVDLTRSSRAQGDHRMRRGLRLPGWRGAS